VATSDIVRLVVLAGLWGASFVFIRVAVAALHPQWVAFLRVTLGFATLLAVALAHRKVPSVRERWRDYLVVGTVNSALPFFLYAFAEREVSASSAAILNATSPFFGAFVAALWLKETLTVRQVLGMCLGVGGVVWVVGWHAAAMSRSALIASCACLAAALCYGIGGVYIKVRMNQIPSQTIALYSLLAAALVLAPATGLSTLPSAPSAVVAVNVLALAIASTGYAYCLYFRLIANIGPTRALTVTFLIPLFGVLWGVAFLGEPLTSDMLFGGLLILAGTWLTTRAAKPRMSPSGERDDQTSSAAGPSTCVRSSR
jgi:drug/metabolite transporter (DMT)-like permease